MFDKALNSIYVIDGITQEFTPNQLLGRNEVALSNLINDESLEPSVKPQEIDDGALESYCALDILSDTTFPLAYATTFTRITLTQSLIESILKDGKFKIGNLRINALWNWKDTPVGSMAAFYESVQSLTEYVDGLGLCVDSFQLKETESEIGLQITNSVSSNQAEDGFSFDPYLTDNATISNKDKYPRVFDPDPKSWVIYIPFDTADFRLGGSALSRTLGLGEVVPALGDVDYFIDCFEVVREFVEDGILVSAAPVGRGGLYSSLSSMLSSGIGLKADISGIMESYQESNRSRVLFAEIPGVVIQIRDSDFDYIDAELLLQDVAYFPLGHPEKNGGIIEIQSSTKTGIQTILESLMQNAEGED